MEQKVSNPMLMRLETGPQLYIASLYYSSRYEDTHLPLASRAPRPARVTTDRSAGNLKKPRELRAGGVQSAGKPVTGSTSRVFTTDFKSEAVSPLTAPPGPVIPVATILRRPICPRARYFARRAPAFRWGALGSEMRKSGADGSRERNRNSVLRCSSLRNRSALVPSSEARSVHFSMAPAEVGGDGLQKPFVGISVLHKGGRTLLQQKTRSVASESRSAWRAGTQTECRAGRGRTSCC